MIITIDGLCGQGKSTVGKKLAEKTGFEFFSTGMLVRYAAYELMKNRDNVLSPDIIVEQIDVKQVAHTDPATLRNNAIIPYLKIVTDSKYRVERLYQLMHEYSENRNMILDGRDTFAYFPDAELRYFFESRIEDRVALRMRTHGMTEKECYEYFTKRDSIEREFPIPYDDLILIHPLEDSMDKLISRLYDDILRIKK
jgi:cytidylate kinase